VTDNQQKLYVRFTFTDGDRFDLKLPSETDAESVYRRTLADWQAGRHVGIRLTDDDVHGGGFASDQIAGISLLSLEEILA